MLDILDFYGRCTRHTVSLRIKQKPEPSYAGILRLSLKTDIPYRKSSERVSGKVVHARHPRFLRKTHPTYIKSSDNEKAGAKLSRKS